MVYKCSVPNCRGNYQYNGPKVRCFSFPRDEALRKKWLKVINRDNFTPTPHTKICELHFTQDDFQTHDEAFNEKTGEMLQIKLEKPRLKNTAIPSVFHDGPKIIYKPGRHRKKIKTDIDPLAVLQNIQESQEISGISGVPIDESIQNFKESYGVNLMSTSNRAEVPIKRTKLSKIGSAKKGNHVYRIMTMGNSSQTKDACSLYGELLITKLRDLDECTRAVAMNEIDNLMFRLKMQTFKNHPLYQSLSALQQPQLDERFLSNSFPQSLSHGISDDEATPPMISPEISIKYENVDASYPSSPTSNIPEC